MTSQTVNAIKVQRNRVEFSINFNLPTGYNSDDFEVFCICGLYMQEVKNINISIRFFFLDIVRPIKH